MLRFPRQRFGIQLSTMGASNTAQGSTGVRYVPYIEELREFFASEGLQHGSPQDIVVLAERIESSQPFAEDLGSMVRSIVLREGGEMPHSQLLEILAVAIGGDELNHAPQQYGQPLRKLLSFMSSALRKSWNDPPPQYDDVSSRNVPPNGGHPGGGHRGELVPFPTHPRPASGRGQAAAISAATERAAAHAASLGNAAKQPPALSFVQREPMDQHASRGDHPPQPGPLANSRTERNVPDVVGEPNPPERSAFDPNMPEDEAIEDPDLQESPPALPRSAAHVATSVPAAASAAPPDSPHAEAPAAAPTPDVPHPVPAHTDAPSWQLAAEAVRGNRLEPLPVVSVPSPLASPAAVSASHPTPAQSGPAGRVDAASDSHATSTGLGPFHETPPAEVLSADPALLTTPPDTAPARPSYVPRVPRSPAGILVATAALLVVAGIVTASLQPAPTSLTGKHSAEPAATPAAAAAQTKPTAGIPTADTASNAQAQKTLRVRRIAMGDDDEVDSGDVAAPYSTPVAGQPQVAKATPYESAPQRADAPSSQTAQQPAPIIRSSTPPSNEVASASVPPPPGAAGRPYPGESYAGGPTGAGTQSSLHPGVTASYRDPDAAIAGDLPRSGRGSRSVVPESPDEVEVSSGVMAGYVLSAPRPDYPTLARVAHIGGPVVLQAVIAKNGSVLATHVLSGHRLLRGAAEDAVRQWRFRPYMMDGHAVEVSTIITLRFKAKH